MRFTFLIVLLSLSALVQAQQLSSSIWQPLSARSQDEGMGISYQVDEPALRARLYEANLDALPSGDIIIELPMGDGELQQFNVIESPIMQEGLAARYPEIRTYRVQGIDDPSASGRLSLTAKGFHGMISTHLGSRYIDPEAAGVYRAFKRDELATGSTFSCGVGQLSKRIPSAQSMNIASRLAARTDGSFRQYRLAVAGTAEYVTAVSTGTPSVSEAQAEIVVAINRVNQIYERDLGVTMELVANNDSLLYTNSATDPYENNDEFTMLSQNQANIDSEIGSSNYDIGHVFGTGGGGIASLGSVCDSNSKAQGATGLSNPTGDPFYIDYVAHEIGHQFSAEHTFNGTTGSCSGGNRWAATAFEPGSGSTVMAYANICGSENIQSFSDAHFHAGSIAEIDAFTTSGGGNGCGTLVSASNSSQPVVDGGIDYTVPAKTPFVLNATASDSDGHALTYSWYQMDAGTATSSSTFGYDLGDNALFRSYLPRSESFRHFPALGTTLANENDHSEVLGCVDRDINFRVTVRDGDISNTRGGMAHDNVVITVDGDAGPFEISEFNTAQTLSPGQYVIRWDVANTDAAPTNCSAVDISLLSFNTTKTTYSEVALLASSSNDGEALITIPSNVDNSRSRFKIQCSNNVFYDISDADLTISGGSSNADNDDIEVKYNTNGLATSSSSLQTCGVATAGPDTTAPVVTAPASISVAAQNESGTSRTQSQIAAFLSAASAIDNVDGVITSITNNAPTLFSEGQTTTVTFSATDAAGNTGTAQANVTVRDYDSGSETGFSNSSGALSPWGVLLLLSFWFAGLVRNQKINDD